MANRLRWRGRVDGKDGSVSGCLGLVVGNAAAAAKDRRRVEIVGSDGTVAALRSTTSESW
ncbi:MAG: hypothetical protein IPG46_20380 [Actinobacteria bacterium]|nr:hypothetical protein [Actinomycetota bacterium]